MAPADNDHGESLMPNDEKGGPAGLAADPGKPKPGKPNHGGGGKAVGRALAIFLALGLAWLAYWFFFMRPYVTTDDAYVTGNQIRLSPRTSGTVAEILFDNTDSVSAGDVVVRLDPTDAAIALGKARESLAQAVRQLASQKAERERLAVLVTAREGDLALIEGEYKRRLNLRTGSSVTAEELERYRQQSAIAQANLDAARHELAAKELLVGQSPVLEHPQVSLAAHQLREAWLALGRCRIKSPASGSVARRTVQVGSHVTPATNLMAIVPLGDVWVEANFKESQLGKIRPGHGATVTADMYGGSVAYRGTVQGLSAGTGGVFSLLPAENATGNWIKVVQRVPVRILLDREDLAKNPLLLGLSLRVEVNVSEPPGPAPADPALASMSSRGTDDEGLGELERLIDAIVAENLGHRPAPTENRPAETPAAGANTP
ncbi:MAG: efflux RND transporter periplasmic adaptor subunit [Deltaproteobacteria bacterium]|jgi:membrane fusion protein (multidrug efflux system)|nr:efflux RND transporter periplasmic adaptor subunit [Deltaproteobacteria bacterium]